MIEISGKLFRLDSIDHVDGGGGTNFATGERRARICLRSGEWIYVDESYDNVKAVIAKAEAEASAYRALDAALAVQ